MRLSRLRLVRPLSDREIAGCFNAGVGRRYCTRLLGGATEPVYEPACAARWGTIRYTRDYARSALHELAHWSIAGARRRRELDYGYCYLPPPRDAAAQAAFYAAEMRVQALEAVLAEVCGVPFEVSTDNLGGARGEDARFAAAVAAERCRLESGALPPRATMLRAELARLAEVIAARHA